ncbi:hypothetical protein DSCW_29870 [Desulfosarcina widdelii]|uniref:Uncharacterized protein n=1 Tax=Desulfosarcina widdelii TaxID=947919 RepID=A0A5K7Z4F2_9BACT|nr:hypothetical protein [Desulfosarcina widdelii]BBO75570.1 hypothetical protein DSCW_29870 [Desulfosarcina widdelii]
MGKIRQLTFVPQIVPSGRDTTLAPDGNLPYLSGYRSEAYSFELNVRYTF